MKWPPINKVRAEARVERGKYKCSSCGEIVGASTIATLKNGKEKRVKNIIVDHINPIVPIEGWDSFDGLIKRLFCGEEGLQLLCRNCHLLKTKEENDARLPNIQ